MVVHLTSAFVRDAGLAQRLPNAAYAHCTVAVLGSVKCVFMQKKAGDLTV